MKFTFQKQPSEVFYKYIQKRLWHSCFPVNFAKFLRTAFLHNISGQLLLSFINKIQLYEIQDF